MKICIGRMVQEALTNAWRHGGGVSQEVSVLEEDETLIVSVRDRGPGLPAGEDVEGVYGLGLAGLAGRVESLGGSLSLRNRRDGRQGTELIVVLDLRSVERGGSGKLNRWDRWIFRATAA